MTDETSPLTPVNTDDTVLILGAGQAAGQCAASLRQNGFDGRLILAGEEDHPPYQRPPLSKAYLSGEIDADRLWVQSLETWAEQKVELRLGQAATAIERTSKSVAFADGESQSYDRLVIATGSRVRPLPVPGADKDGVLYLRNIADVDRLKAAVTPGKRIAIIGGGYIGLEAAAVAKKLGAQPVVIEAMDRLLARVATPELSEFVRQAHEKRGVDILLDSQVAEITGLFGAAKGVKLADGRKIECDTVLVGIGILPNQELAEHAGLDVENGIKINAWCQTSDLDVLAIGDCTRQHNVFYDRELRLESVPNALEQAKHAAAALTGRPAPKAELPWFWSDQFDLKIQTAGLIFDVDRTIIRGSLDAERFALFHYAGPRLVAADAVNDPASFMAAKMMISQGKSPDPDELDDQDRSIKEIMKAALAS